MFQAGHILLRQLIAVAQARPAVPSFHELVAKAKLRFRMLAEIGNPPDIKPGGERLADTQSISIVEAERPAHKNPVVGQCLVNRFLPLKSLARKNLLTDSSGVFRIDVDISSA